MYLSSLIYDISRKHYISHITFQMFVQQSTELCAS